MTADEQLARALYVAHGITMALRGADMQLEAELRRYIWDHNLEEWERDIWRAAVAPFRAELQRAADDVDDQARYVSKLSEEHHL